MSTKQESGLRLEEELKPLRFYVAGSFSNREEMKQLMDRVKQLGYDVPVDWTTHKPIKPYEKNPEMAGVYAQEDLEGAIDCDFFVLFPEAEGGSMQFAELGAAVASKKVKRVFVVGPHNQRSMLFFHPKVERVTTFEEVLALIK